MNQSPYSSTSKRLVQRHRFIHNVELSPYPARIYSTPGFAPYVSMNHLYVEPEFSLPTISNKETDLYPVVRENAGDDIQKSTNNALDYKLPFLSKKDNKKEKELLNHAEGAGKSLAATGETIGEILASKLSSHAPRCIIMHRVRNLVYGKLATFSKNQ